MYTGENEITAMIALVDEDAGSIESRFLEPSCGNGNFLVAILNKKLTQVFDLYSSQKRQDHVEFNILRALSSIYGVDISPENVSESIERMIIHVKDWYSEKLHTLQPNDKFYTSVEYILKQNIVVGDMINGVKEIVFVEF